MPKTTAGIVGGLTLGIGLGFCFDHAANHDAPAKASNQASSIAKTMARYYAVKRPGTPAGTVYPESAPPRERNSGMVSDRLLSKIAYLESHFNRKAVNPDTRATGILQFKDDRFLELLYQHGEELGYGRLSRHITHTVIRDRTGRAIRDQYDVDNPALKRYILKARENVALSKALARAGLEDNMQQLDNLMDGYKVPKTPTTIYMTHFLGVGGAARALKAMAEEPRAAFSQVTQSGVCQKNPGYCYTENGHQRNISQFYSYIHTRLASAPGDWGR